MIKNRLPENYWQCHFFGVQFVVMVLIHSVPIRKTWKISQNTKNTLVFVNRMQFTREKSFTTEKHIENKKKKPNATAEFTLSVKKSLRLPYMIIR